MSEENKSTESANTQPTVEFPQGAAAEAAAEEAAKAGSSDKNIAGPATGGVDAGESAQKQSPTDEGNKSAEAVSKEQYEELEKKLGTQGQELGEFREFFNQISPLLDKLDKQPELVQAIIDGKVDGDLAKAALEGKVSAPEAQAVSQAHEEVKKEVGKEKYEAMDPKAIEKLVSDKAKDMVAGIEERLKKNIDEVEEMRTFENRVNEFVAKTEDFAEYAKDIDKWFDEHPDQTDIEIAYNTVKGAALQAKAKEAQQKEEGEAAKDAAADAGGGPSQNATIISDEGAADKLIGSRSNPNVF